MVSFSKLGVASVLMLLLDIILNVWIWSFIPEYQDFFDMFFKLSISVVFLVIVIILSIISLIQIKKYNLRGRWLSILTLIFSIIVLILILFSLFNPLYVMIVGLRVTGGDRDYYYNIPVKADVSGSSFKISPISESNLVPDIFILTINETNFIPQKCMIDNYYFLFSSGNYLSQNSLVGKQISSFEGGYPRDIDNNELISDSIREGAKATYKQKSKVYTHYSFSEPENKVGNVENMLKNDNGEFYIRYRMDPFTQIKTIYSDEDMKTDGCIVDIRRSITYSNLTLPLKSEKTINYSYKNIICLRKYDELDKVAEENPNMNGQINRTIEGCVFYEVESIIYITFISYPFDGTESYKLKPIF